jgi:uncharacterized protein (TIGR02145 family)
MRILPANCRGKDGEPLGRHALAFFWSSSEIDAASAWSRSFDGATDEMVRQEMDKVDGLGVRCVRDRPRTE